MISLLQYVWPPWVIFQNIKKYFVITVNHNDIEGICTNTQKKTLIISTWEKANAFFSYWVFTSNSSQAWNFWAFVQFPQVFDRCRQWSWVYTVHCTSFGIPTEALELDSSNVILLSVHIRSLFGATATIDIVCIWF